MGNLNNFWHSKCFLCIKSVYEYMYLITEETEKREFICINFNGFVCVFNVALV